MIKLKKLLRENQWDDLKNKSGIPQPVIDVWMKITAVVKKHGGNPSEFITFSRYNETEDPLSQTMHGAFGTKTTKEDEIRTYTIKNTDDSKSSLWYNDTYSTWLEELPHDGDVVEIDDVRLNQIIMDWI